MHIHIGVDSLDRGIRFYGALFGADPQKVKHDYARWMLDDPRINFAISTRGKKAGLDHLGLQVDDVAELAVIRERLQQADIERFDEGETVCCYAHSEKSWVRDPAGIAWESYHTMADAELYSPEESSPERACCSADRAGRSECCD